MRKVLYIVGGLILLLLLVVILLPFLIDANKYRPQIESALDSSLSRKVEIGNIRLSLFSGGVEVDNLSISDDPAFSSSPFLTAKSLTVGVEMMPLIFSRQVHITAITIDQPKAALLRSASGAWNFSSLGATVSKPKEKAAGASSSAADVTVQKLSIKNGTLSVGDAGGKGKTHEYDQVNLEASNLSYTSQFPFELTAKTSGNGTLKLAGKAGPLDQANMAATAVDASLEVRNLDLTSTGFIDPSSGIAGLLDFTGTLISDGKKMNSKGKASANKLRLVPGGSPAGHPVQVDYDADYDLKPQTGALKQCDVHIGKAAARLSGTFNASGEEASVQMKFDGDNMPAPDLESVLPAIGVTLPSGASLKEGTLNAHLTISGPVNRLVTAGPVTLSNGKLTGFDLGAKMGALASFVGGPKGGADTVIETFSSALRVAHEGIRADALTLVVPAIGRLTGNGTVGSDQKLDFKMVAYLSSSASPLGAIVKLGALGGSPGGSGGIPFKIEGTTSNPLFVPDMTGIAGGLAKGATSGVPATGQDLSNLGKQLGGLFGKKKNP
jgi:AsmA protein